VAHQSEAGNTHHGRLGIVREEIHFHRTDEEDQEDTDPRNFHDNLVEEGPHSVEEGLQSVLLEEARIRKKEEVDHSKIVAGKLLPFLTEGGLEHSSDFLEEIDGALLEHVLDPNSSPVEELVDGAREAERRPRDLQRDEMSILGDLQASPDDLE
jgi:hypothetical protein